MNDVLLSSEASAQLVRTLGSAGFSDCLLATLRPICRPDHMSLIHLEPHAQVSYICSASTHAVTITPAMQQLYLSIYYRLDPNRDFIDKFASDSDILLRRLQQSDINDNGYRQLWYRKMGIVDRVSILSRADKGLYCLNLFRTQDSFEASALEGLEQNKPLLAALALKHSRLAGALSPFMTRDAQILTLIERLEKTHPALTTREKEVCARILLGMSSDGIALDLAIKTQSVLTYRKRAYARLKISSQNELFALCLTLS